MLSSGSRRVARGDIGASGSGVGFDEREGAASISRMLPIALEDTLSLFFPFLPLGVLGATEPMELHQGVLNRHNVWKTVLQTSNSIFLSKNNNDRPLPRLSLFIGRHLSKQFNKIQSCVFSTSFNRVNCWSKKTQRAPLWLGSSLGTIIRSSHKNSQWVPRNVPALLFYAQVSVARGPGSPAASMVPLQILSADMTRAVQFLEDGTRQAVVACRLEVTQSLVSRLYCNDTRKHDFIAIWMVTCIGRSCK